MPAYVVRDDIEASGANPFDAAYRSLEIRRYRTGNITLQIRLADADDTAWQPVVVNIPGIGI
jgi:hypothetical protein